MVFRNEYVKEKTNLFIDAYYELMSKLNSMKGKTIQNAARQSHSKDIDQDYKLVVSLAWRWAIVVKESGAIIGEVHGLGDMALPELLSTFVEYVIEDYDFLG